MYRFLIGTDACIIPDLISFGAFVETVLGNSNKLLELPMLNGKETELEGLPGSSFEMSASV